jgi:hypothetical protein
MYLSALSALRLLKGWLSMKGMEWTQIYVPVLTKLEGLKLTQNAPTTVMNAYVVTKRGEWSIAKTVLNIKTTRLAPVVERFTQGT